MNLADPNSQLDIGTRIRKRRRALHMTLTELAEKTGLTASSISQLERGKTTGSIRSLQSVAQELGIGFSDLFSDSRQGRNTVIDLAEITTHEYGVFASKALLSPKSFDHMQVFVGFLQPGGSTGKERITHGDSEEMVIVLSGVIKVTLGDEIFPLTQHQSISFISSQPHKIEEAVGRPASLLWVIAPPTV